MNSRGGSTQSQKVPPQSPPLMNQIQQIVTVNKRWLCFLTVLTTEAETVQVKEGWKSLTPSSRNCQLRSLGVNSRMMPDLEMSLDVTPSVQCTDESSAGRKSWLRQACQISVKDVNWCSENADNGYSGWSYSCIFLRLAGNEPWGHSCSMTSSGRKDQEKSSPVLHRILGYIPQHYITADCATFSA